MEYHLSFFILFSSFKQYTFQQFVKYSYTVYQHIHTIYMIKMFLLYSDQHSFLNLPRTLVSTDTEQSEQHAVHIDRRDVVGKYLLAKGGLGPAEAARGTGRSGLNEQVG